MISERGRSVNDPFDPYGSLSALTLRRVQFTDRILHVIRETWKKQDFMISERVRSGYDPFDPYGSLIALTLRRVQFTDRGLHVIRET